MAANCYNESLEHFLGRLAFFLCFDTLFSFVRTEVGPFTFWFGLGKIVVFFAPLIFHKIYHCGFEVVWNSGSMVTWLAKTCCEMFLS